MAVIVELALDPTDFEIGRILTVPSASSVTLETLVPLGPTAVPLVRLHHAGRAEFERAVRESAKVRSLTAVNGHDDQHLYALDWDVAEDAFFAAIRETDGQILQATGEVKRWTFRLWFPDHDCVSDFQTALADAELAFDLHGIYNPTKPDAGPWFGLTKAQRDTLVLAVDNGYYDIPRRISTAELAEEFGISDQAVTERLRRAIAKLTTNALLVDEDEAPA